MIEGLLTGNINILKLPQADSGLTIAFFQHLIETEPSLQRYIYVFDTPSSDMDSMKKMADCADGIAIWGGDTAVQAVRRLAPPGCRLIEWGHRLSFCYISGTSEETELEALANHILITRQLLCSACQVIYINTDDMKKVCAFCELFLPYLEAAEKQYPITETNAAAELTLRRYTAELESVMYGENQCRRIFQGKKCSLTACTDSRLELSYLYGNPLVKRLPDYQMMDILRQSKGYLQTAGLICSPADRVRFTEMLMRCGVTRILTAGRMSDTFLGEAHDGEYPLRRYTRIVDILT